MWRPRTAERLITNSNTGNNATIIIPNSSIEGLQIGDEVGILNHKGDLAGSVVYDGTDMAIVVWGNDQVTSDDRHMTVGEPYKMVVSRYADGSVHELWPMYKEGASTYSVNGISIVENAKLNAAAEDVVNETIVHSYPNPAKSTVFFDIMLPEASDVYLEIFDLSGKMVLTPQRLSLSAGHSVVDVDVNKLSAGEYFYRIGTKNNSVNGAIIIIR